MAKEMKAQKEVTGYEIREAINRWRLRKQVAERQFRDSVYVFKGDDKKSLDELATIFTEADTNIALLEDLRQNFNMQTKVRVADKEMTLSVAVKLFGGRGRLEKLWRDACIEPHDRYSSGYDRRARSNDQEYAQRSVNMGDCMTRADEAAKNASQLRSAISVANGNKIVVPREYPANLFE